MISNIFIEPSELTDHKYIICETSNTFHANDNKAPQENETNLSNFNYETADWESIRANLRMINWSIELEEHKTSEDKLRVFMEIVMKIVEENCKKFKSHKGCQTNRIPRDRRILLRKKKKLNLKLKCKISNKRKTVLEQDISKINKKLLDSHKDEKIMNEARAITNIKSNPKHFFSYTKKNLKTKNVIGPFKINDSTINTFSDICKLLSNQFTSSFSIPDENFKIVNPKNFFNVETENKKPLLMDIDFTESSFVDVIKEINSNSSPGTDH